MSLRKKIIFGFAIGAVIITILAAFEYFNFIEVRNEMRFLEEAASLRNQSLQLRRHEKNFFLFPSKAEEEAGATRDYLNQISDTINSTQAGDPEKISQLQDLVNRYGQNFFAIEKLLPEVAREFEERSATFAPQGASVPLLELYSRDNPRYVADYLQNNFALPADDPQVVRLRELDADITALRETGENITVASTDLDTDARNGAESGIQLSQNAILVFIPLFLLIGLGAMLYISTDVVKRLRKLSESVDRIGARYSPGAPEPHAEHARNDEVDVLIDRFNDMNSQLITWEGELEEKNQELLRSKKLAAIGTLASGVAHELNNPLNNISISAQVLKKQAGSDGAADSVIVDDIIDQTARVRGIVGNMLEFAREREPRLEDVELTGLVRRAYDMVSGTRDTGGVGFRVDPEEAVYLRADPAQLEQVFVNLFTNAIAAMDGKGDLSVRIEPEDGRLRIFVSDTGAGISAEDRDKVFDPFFTRKEKGTGLGLAIVMNIVRKHGGDISLVSEEGMGTVFEITLPEGGTR
jgi:signal transduction histidine kinase